MQSTTSSPDLALSNDIRSKGLRRRMTGPVEPTGTEAEIAVAEAEHGLAVAQSSGHQDWIDAAEQRLQVERDLAPKPPVEPVDFDAGRRGPPPRMSGSDDMSQLMRADWLGLPGPEHLPDQYR